MARRRIVVIGNRQLQCWKRQEPHSPTLLYFHSRSLLDPVNFYLDDLQQADEEQGTEDAEFFGLTPKGLLSERHNVDGTKFNILLPKVSIRGDRSENKDGYSILAKKLLIIVSQSGNA